MADSSAKTAGSRVRANPLWQKVVGLCGPLLFDLREWNEDEKTTGASGVNSFLFGLQQEKGVREVCTSNKQKFLAQQRAGLALL